MNMAAVTTEREVIAEFLELYKEFTCLWDTSSKQYSNKDARNQALEILLDKLKIIDRDATIATVKKRIENLRAAYKKELKKVQQSKTSGAGDVYIPTLWYYEYLNFLDEKDTLNRSGVDTIISCDEDEITESVHQESLSTSALLYYCQRKILRPYSRLLCVMGLSPSTVENTEHYCILTCCGYKHLILVLALMCVGYVLQYMTCFRRDRGFDYRNDSTIEVQDREYICYGNIAFSYIVPGLLHMSAYVYALYLFRINENEQLQSLMERALLVSGGFMAQRKIVYTLWIFIGLGILWVTASVVNVSVMVADGTIVFQWLQHSSAGGTNLLKVLLVLSTLWHDMVQATLITSYCLQSQLLSLHVQSLRERLVQYVISHGDWMREIREFRKLLKYLNEDLAPIVCILSIVNISFALSGISWLLKFDSIDTETEPINGVSILNAVLWVLIAVAPFIQAARLTAACVSVRDVGHEVRTRPFVYETTSRQDLDSILLYTSSLRMNSELFKVPVTGRYLCMAATIGTIVIITLGQCHVL